MAEKYRKIVVGESWSHCVYYVKGSKYTLGKKKCDIVEMVDGGEGKVDVYVTDGDSIKKWKSIKLSEALDTEYDIDFD